MTQECTKDVRKYNIQVLQLQTFPVRFLALFCGQLFEYEKSYDFLTSAR